MIEQQGQVVGVSGGCARVRLGGRSGCAACDAGKGCGAGVFGRLLQRRPLVLEFDNTIDAESGQSVVVGLPETLFLSLIARFYLLPLLAGLGGAAVGHYVSVRFQAPEAWRDVAALMGAVLCGALAFRRSRVFPAEFSAPTAVHLLRVGELTDTEKRNACE